MKTDDFVRDGVEVSKDLEATDHTLLECEKKYDKGPNDIPGNNLNESGISVKTVENFTMLANKLELKNYSLEGLVLQLEKKNVKYFFKISLCLQIN